MKKILFAICITFLIYSSAFGNATDDLFKALEDENATAKQIQRLIKRGADVNAVKNFAWYPGWEKENLTPLMIAVRNNNFEVVKALIKAGANVNYYDEKSSSALGEVIYYYRSYDILRVLIDAGADVNVKDEDGWTPLMLAMPYDNALENIDEQVKILLKAGANINVKDKHGITPLMVAASSYGVSALIKAGADINAKDQDGWTPLMWAAAFDDIDNVKSLLKAGADINVKDKYGMTALFWAVAVSPIAGSLNPDIVKILIDAGADVNIKNKDGTNVLLTAIMRKNFYEIMTGLGEDIDAKIAEKIDTMVNHFGGLGAADDLNTFYNERLKIIKNLQKAGLDLNAKNNEGRTALMEASVYSNVVSVQALVDAGADVFEKNNSGKTAYDLAGTSTVKKILKQKINGE